MFVFCSLRLILGYIAPLSLGVIYIKTQLLRMSYLVKQTFERMSSKIKTQLLYVCLMGSVILNVGCLEADVRT